MDTIAGIAPKGILSGLSGSRKIAVAVPNAAQGMTEKGNIDLYSRPTVRNGDGSISTVRSIGVEIDGKQYLIPTVAADGSRILSDEEAIRQFIATGQHLGAFQSPQASNYYANQLHRDQERLYDAR